MVLQYSIKLHDFFLVISNFVNTYNIFLSHIDMMYLITMFFVALRYSLRVWQYLDHHAAKNSGYTALFILFLMITSQIVLVLYLPGQTVSRLGIIGWLIYLSAILVLMLIVITLTTDLSPFIGEEAKKDLRLSKQRIYNPYTREEWLFRYFTFMWFSIAAFLAFNYYVYIKASFVTEIRWPYPMTYLQYTGDDLFVRLVDSIIYEYSSLFLSILLQAVCMALIIHSLFGIFEVFVIDKFKRTEIKNFIKRFKK